MRKWCLALWAVSQFACQPHGWAIDAAVRYDAFEQAASEATPLPLPVRTVLISALYEVMFSSVRAHTSEHALSKQDLDALYHAATIVASESLSNRYLETMKYYLGVLQARHLDTLEQVTRMHDLLVSARRWKEANDLIRDEPQLHAKLLPDVQEEPLVAGQPTEVMLDLDKHALIRRSVDIHQPSQVIVVSHPLCHFSQNAVTAIDADPELSKIFHEHARWLAPQNAPLEWDQFARWNQSHPRQKMSIAFQRDEWPMLHRWNLPTFYFFQNGVLRSEVHGWPKAGHRTELLAALAQIGIAP